MTAEEQAENMCRSTRIKKNIKKEAINAKKCMEYKNIYQDCD